ncbi:hypothetical protein BJ944DRAFT_259518 [Cunninghamella echinulata]|nr:hypothetical protein BJ944DRAFT_259518 [Cunninghamella echinulata]
MTQSYRIHVELKPKTPVVFSYPDLVKRHEQIVGKIPALAMDLDNEQDSFFKSLLERAAKYDINPDEEEDADSGEEENVPSNTKGEEYDYEDPFIDDSEMMLDEHYDYVEPEIDGYFVFHGSLDGEAISNLKKKSKKEKSKTTDKGKGTTSTTNAAGSSSTGTNSISTAQTVRTASSLSSSSSSASSASSNKAITGLSSSARKNNSNTDTIEISDTEEESAADGKSKKSSNTNSDTSTKLTPTLKRSTSTSSSSTENNKKTNKSNKASSSTSLTANINNNKANKSTNNESRNSGNESSSSTNAAVAAAKKKKVITTEDLEPLDPSMEPLMDKLRQDRQKEDFAIKSKFPTSLRPTVIEIGVRMFRLYNKVDDNVINHLMYILPYNRFTLNKFVTTKSGPMVVAEWKQEIEEMTKKLKIVVDEMMPDQIQQYEQKVLEQQSTQSDEVTNDVEQKFRFNEATKKLIYDILTKDMYSVLISNEVAELTERPDMISSETKARKSMYTKLLSCWPQGWMSTFDISRQYSIMKTSIKMKLKNAEEAASKTSGTTSTNSTGFKRSNGSNLKRPAPSSSANSPTSSRNINTNNNNTVQNNEKRKKLNNEAHYIVINDESNENVTQELNTNATDNDKELNSTYQPSQPSQTSQRPISMKIESLISGP